jgi:hypothetical protein
MNRSSRWTLLCISCPLNVLGSRVPGIPTGVVLSSRPRASVAQDVVIKLIIRHASMRRSELNPEAIGRERAVVVLFGEAMQQLLQGPGGVHRESVAGEKQDGRCLRKSDKPDGALEGIMVCFGRPTVKDGISVGEHRGQKIDQYPELGPWLRRPVHA